MPARKSSKKFTLSKGDARRAELFFGDKDKAIADAKELFKKHTASIGVDIRTRAERESDRIKKAQTTTKKEKARYKEITAVPAGEYPADAIIIELWKNPPRPFKNNSDFFRLLDEQIEAKKVKGINRRETELRVPVLLRTKLIENQLSNGQRASKKMHPADNPKIRINATEKAIVRKSPLATILLPTLKKELKRRLRSKDPADIKKIPEAVLVYRVRTGLSGGHLKLDLKS